MQNKKPIYGMSAKLTRGPHRDELGQCELTTLTLACITPLSKQG